MNIYLTHGYYYVAVKELNEFSFRCDTRMIFWFRTEAEFEETMRKARRDSLVLITE